MNVWMSHIGLGPLVQTLLPTTSPIPGVFKDIVYFDWIHISIHRIHESALLQLNHRWVSVLVHVIVPGALLCGDVE